jgi:hypothetical protein
LPVHDRDQIGVPGCHWYIGNVRALDLVHLTDLPIT